MVGVRPRARHRPGKSRRPDEQPGLTPQDAPALEGDAADERLAQESRRTTPRRALEQRPGFAEASPDVGELDLSVVEEAHRRDPDTTLELVAAMATATDRGLREKARRLAHRLAWREARSTAPTTVRGTGRMRSVRGLDPQGELDLDRSMDHLTQARAGSHALEPDELWSRRWSASRTAWCLVLDRSGSMDGEALATACLTTAGFWLRAHEQRAVLTFADDVVALGSLGDGRTGEEVLDRVLGLRGRGTTHLAPALRAAADQLGRTSARRRRTVLLSDCRATTPDDVVAAAGLLDELAILAPAADPAAARELARAVDARLETVSAPSDVPAALRRLLD
ncbi:vWA domain-containing protein [Marmoricola endophyticus]|uniref:vWA domain-containing protein n=1 Tax=Marmoricola endophyticus TaxID=2040280 RepID=UPI001669B27F|nr:vWA domain-containing protein [Marmoricola endophyticus]